MGLVRVAPLPTVYPISLEEAKQQLNIVHDAANDKITAKIKAATLRIENYLERALIAQTWRLTLDDFPEDGGEIVLPRPRLIEVESIIYTDIDGEEQELDEDDFAYNADEEPAKIIPVDGVVVTGSIWPVTNYGPGNVQVTYTAGYGEDAASVPDDIKEAIKQMVAILYDNPTADMPADLCETLMPYRVGIAEYV